MILDPVTLPLTAKVLDAKQYMSEFSIGGIPIVDEDGTLKGIVTNRDLRFEHKNDRPIIEVMTCIMVGITCIEEFMTCIIDTMTFIVEVMTCILEALTRIVEAKTCIILH